MSRKLVQVLICSATFSYFVLMIEPRQKSLDYNVQLHQNETQHRDSRLFLNRPWFWPRKSPLYLINGTVCRFLNFNQLPVCTTLSTNGLLPNTAARVSSSSGSELQSSALQSGNQGAQSSVEYVSGGQQSNGLDDSRLVVSASNNSDTPNLYQRQPTRQTSSLVQSPTQPLVPVYIRRGPFRIPPLRAPVFRRPLNYGSLARIKSKIII